MKKIIDLNRIKKASQYLSQSTEIMRNTFLKNLCRELEMKRESIIIANIIDIKNAQNDHLADSFVERLTLDEKVINTLVNKVKKILKLDSDIGKVLDQRVGDDGILIKKIGVPIGVVAVIYEARPEVTIDVAALCIKSGNSAILKGGTEAMNTNKILYKCIQNALLKSRLPKEAIGIITTKNRNVVDYLLKQHEYIDLVIARGGYGLVNHVINNSTIPVLAHGAGGARIFIDESADFTMVEKIVVNAKTSKPAACNSLNTILIHQKISARILKRLKKILQDQGIEIIENDWTTEFLDLRISMKIVKNVDDAIRFVNRYGKKHTEGIIADDKKVIDKFVKQVDAAAIFVNASTRLHDGYVFGMGSEMGIATGKLHARGPVGLKDLTSYKWQIYGNGNIRK